MNLIVCLDDNNGMSFGGRRQSRDRVQLARLTETVGKNRLFISHYSEKLFEGADADITVCEAPLLQASEGDFCFIENQKIEGFEFEKVIIYRWNRSYPSDLKFDVENLKQKNLLTVHEFKGNSHEKITEEIYG